CVRHRGDWGDYSFKYW
nr:immunoglobulin heavy chain junction region [Macaca mulatta]